MYHNNRAQQQQQVPPCIPLVYRFERELSAADRLRPVAPASSSFLQAVPLGSFSVVLVGSHTG